MRLRVNSFSKQVSCSCHNDLWRLQGEDEGALVLKCSNCGALMGFKLKSNKRKPIANERLRRAFHVLLEAGAPEPLAAAKILYRRRNTKVLRFEGGEVYLTDERSILLSLIAQNGFEAALKEAAFEVGMAVVL